MKVVHITETVDGASGVATFVRELDSALQESGVESQVYTLGESPDWNGVEVVHIHGLWLRGYHAAAQEARKRNISVVWSTHGMTAPWSMRHKWWKKVPAWVLYQQGDLKRAVAIHCTTEQEKEWNRQLGFDKCFTVPLGTRELDKVKICKYPIPIAKDQARTVLFVGRIYPVKGLANLIKAWGIVVKSGNVEGGNKWKLRLVGPDQTGHQAALEKLVQELNLGDSVEFAGPKFGDDLSAEYDACDCLVLPSFTENFGATIVDAMAHGKVCIASTFTPWQELCERNCGWLVSNEPQSLAWAIREMMEAGDARRKEMGARGRALVEEKYTWGAVAEAMAKHYKEVVK